MAVEYKFNPKVLTKLFLYVQHIVSSMGRHKVVISLKEIKVSLGTERNVKACMYVST